MTNVPGTRHGRSRPIMNVPNTRTGDGYLAWNGTEVWERLELALLIDNFVAQDAISLTRCFKTLVVSTRLSFLSPIYHHIGNSKPYVWLFSWQIFNFNMATINWDDYIEILVLGIKQYLMKDRLENLNKARWQVTRYVPLYPISLYHIVVWNIDKWLKPDLWSANPVVPRFIIV